jgi:hypothetical protein
MSTVQGTTGHESRGLVTALRRVAGVVLPVSPLLFGVPVVVGISVSVARLLSTPYPDLGWATLVNNDAQQLYLGHTLYQNPAHGYTGSLYTPLLPALVSILLHIYMWNGWSLLITILASVALAALAVSIAYQPINPLHKWVRVAGAAGIGGLVYWCVSSVSPSLLDEGGVDQLAWAFALFGLVATAGLEPESSRRSTAVSALLLSAALWTKQTTVVVPAVALAWVWGGVAISTLAGRTAWLFTAILIGVNVAVLVTLNLLSDGWELYINFEMGLHHLVFPYYGAFIQEGLRSSALALMFAFVVWMVCAVSPDGGSSSTRRRSWTVGLVCDIRDSIAGGDLVARRALLLALYLPCGFALAMICVGKQGAADSEFLGVVWALGLLGACGWHMAQRHTREGLMAGGCVAACFALFQLEPVRQLAVKAQVNIPTLSTQVHWPQVPSELRSWARHHTVYMPVLSDLNVNQGILYPNSWNIVDLLAAGEQPLYLVHALLDRRFEGVRPFISNWGGRYSSAYGEWEENYLWKIDQVIAARYVAQPGLPRGVLGRRPGPERGAWMRHCFGPFSAGGARFRIRHGGGFWCSFRPGQLRLVSTPTTLSEVVTTQPTQLPRLITVSLSGDARARVELVLKSQSRPDLVVSVTTSPRDARNLVVTISRGGVVLGVVTVPSARSPGERRSVQLVVSSANRHHRSAITRGASGVTVSVPIERSELAFIATQGSEVDLSQVGVVESVRGS